MQLGNGLITHVRQQGGQRGLSRCRNVTATRIVQEFASTALRKLQPGRCHQNWAPTSCVSEAECYSLVPDMDEMSRQVEKEGGRGEH